MCCGIGHRHPACPAISDVTLDQIEIGLIGVSREISFQRWTLVGQSQMRASAVQCSPTPPVRFECLLFYRRVCLVPDRVIPLSCRCFHLQRGAIDD